MICFKEVKFKEHISKLNMGLTYPGCRFFFFFRSEAAIEILAREPC